MAWLAVDKDGCEIIFSEEPVRSFLFMCWFNDEDKEGEDIGEMIELPKGSIKKLIDRDLTWEDEPVELK